MLFVLSYFREVESYVSSRIVGFVLVYVVFGGEFVDGGYNGVELLYGVSLDGSDLVLERAEYF